MPNSVRGPDRAGMTAPARPTPSRLASSPVDPPAGFPDISDWNFWIGAPCGASARGRSCVPRPACRSTPSGRSPDAPSRPGPGYCARHPPRRRLAREPQPRAVLLGRGGVNIGDLPHEIDEFFGSMINMDDPKHFRLRSIVSKGFTPEADRRCRGATCKHVAAQHRRPLDRRAPRPALRLRRGVRRATPARDHLRHDGHPRERRAADLRVDEHDPRRRRPRVRRQFEKLIGPALGDVPATPRRSARTAWPTRRDDITSALMAAEVDGERLTPQEFGVVLHPARRGRQRDHPQRDQPRHAGAHRPPRPARAAGVDDFDGALADRGRGDRALGDAGDPLPAHRHRRHRARRPADHGGRQGRDVLQLGEPRRARCSPTRTAST